MLIGAAIAGTVAAVMEAGVLEGAFLATALILLVMAAGTARQRRQTAPVLALCVAILITALVPRL